MKKHLTGLVSIILCIMLACSTTAALATESNEVYFGDSTTTAYGTNIEYIADLDMYVMCGKGIYTSKNGKSWMSHSGSIDGMGDNIEFYGAAYGGPEGSEILLLISENQKNLSVTGNKTFVLDKYLTNRKTVYTYIKGELEDGTDDTPLLLRGCIEWDEGTGKFWTGAALENNTGAGLYYSDGTITPLGGKNRIYWKKADTGFCSFNESAVYTTATSAMRPVFANITFDGKGHIIAQPVWRNGSDAYTYSTAKSSTGTRSCNTAELVDASGNTVITKLFDFTNGANNLAYIGLDKHSNILTQSTANSNNTPTTIRAMQFDYLFAFDSGTTVTGTNVPGYATEIKNISNNTLAMVKSNYRGSYIGKLVTLSDKLVIVPFTAGTSTAASLEDVLVLTYPEDYKIVSGCKTQAFINNAAKVDEIIGTSSSDQNLVIDAVEGENESVLVLTGKNPLNGAGWLATNGGKTQITCIETENTITDSKDTETDGIDRSAKVTVTSQATKQYSHIKPADEAEVILTTPGATIEFPADVYEALRDADGNRVPSADATYSAAVLSGDYGEDTSILFDSMNEGEFDISENAPNGDYSYNVLLTADGTNGMICNAVTYTVKVRDSSIVVNDTSMTDPRTSPNLRSGLVNGSNTITVTPTKQFAGVDSVTKVIAVYKNESLVECESIVQTVTDGTIGQFGITFDIPEGDDVNDYSYKIMLWTEDLRPL